ncbi:MAG: ISAs1 family transposase [Armatimonadetes bacterium]|nr:ISAs1 family transposase [Armatimonadota bacterium]
MSDLFFDAATGQAALHLVSAGAQGSRLAQGQVAVAGKGNEITALPALLSLLDLSGSAVTIDAIGCQTQIAAQVVAGGGDYVLALTPIKPQGQPQSLKDNHPTPHGNMAWFFAQLAARCHSRHSRVRRRQWQQRIGRRRAGSGGARRLTV